MIKLLVVFGTRPEAIKMSPLVKMLQKFPDKYETTVCVTGQHREMLDQVLKIFEITPDFDLNIMKKGQDLYDVTSKVLVGMKDVLLKSAPDLVLVHGDTTTSFATALAAFYQKIQVAHIEAGLRTHDPYNPWPEEINRQLTGRIANYHFSPTQNARYNLEKEGISGEQIFITGNTVIDALHMATAKFKSKEVNAFISSILYEAGIGKELIEDWTNGHRKMILITGHRRENFGEGFLNICHAIKELSVKYPACDFVYPVHLNPNVRKPVAEILGEGSHSNIHLLEPLDYLPFVFLMNLSELILTDSGGIQEEAPGLGKPVLVMRETTERPEAVEAGTVLLVSTDKKKIIDHVSLLLENPDFYEKMSRAVNPYGDGKACERILEILNTIYYQ